MYIHCSEITTSVVDAFYKSQLLHDFVCGVIVQYVKRNILQNILSLKVDRDERVGQILQQCLFGFCITALECTFTQFLQF